MIPTLSHSLQVVVAALGDVGGRPFLAGEDVHDQLLWLVPKHDDVKGHGGEGSGPYLLEG
jgi:hypothetical protein